MEKETGTFTSMAFSWNHRVDFCKMRDALMDAEPEGATIFVSPQLNSNLVIQGVVEISDPMLSVAKVIEDVIRGMETDYGVRFLAIESDSDFIGIIDKDASGNTSVVVDAG